MTLDPIPRNSEYSSLICSLCCKISQEKNKTLIEFYALICLYSKIKHLAKNSFRYALMNGSISGWCQPLD